MKSAFLICCLAITSAVAKLPAEICTAENKGKTVCNELVADICISDGLIICTATVSDGIPIKCPKDKSHCVINEVTGSPFCSSTPSSTCSSISSGFMCTDEGIFPDPFDCKKFHYCHDNGGTLESEEYVCADRHVFDPSLPSLGFCRFTNNLFCITPKCDGVLEVKNQLLMYIANRQYVALCIPDGDPIIFNCPLNTIPDLTQIPVQCNYRCLRAGLFPYEKSEEMYYECSRDLRGQLNYELKTCFPGWYFKTNMCVKSPTTTAAPPVPPVAAIEAATEPTTD